mmetsp:Transcript_38255/g.151400  ORF Transcript_38255/g.151400 Transcript_38255/m.151400 type:complete len:109 (-) Transcript_38255:275-601(-)
MVSREMLKQIYDIEFGDPQLRQVSRVTVYTQLLTFGFGNTICTYSAFAVLVLFFCLSSFAAAFVISYRFARVKLNIKLLKTVAFFGIAAWFIRNNGQLLEFPIELKRA